MLTSKKSARFNNWGEMMKLTMTFLISATLVLGGCGTPPLGENLSSNTQDGVVYNGVVYNGIGFFGTDYTGLGYNGSGYQGIGFTGSTLTNSLPTMYWGADWGLNDWLNNREVDGITPINKADRDASLVALAYWTECACAAGDNLPWTGNNPYPTPHTETRYFSGAFNLAPNWCHGTGPVPAAEQEAVSACLLARVNELGFHNALSLRGSDSSLALGDNEKLFMAWPEAQYWGNAWETADSISDGTHFFKNLSLIHICADHCHAAHDIAPSPARLRASDTRAAALHHDMQRAPSLSYVACVIPCSRHRSVAILPASACFKIPMI